jgi:hypothetical protein
LIEIFVLLRRRLKQPFRPEPPDENRLKKIRFIESLDVYIVSPGGVSSNYINDYFRSKGLKVGSENDLWYDLCHIKRVYTNKVKTICLYGDFENAILSPHYRNFIKLNMNKIHETKGKPISYFLEKYPKDPYGLKEQYRNFSKNANTWMLRYPYTKSDLEKIIREMGFRFDTSDIEIKSRREKKHLKLTDELKRIIDIYNKNDPY